MTIFINTSSSTAFFKLQSNVSLLVPSPGRDTYDTLQSNVHLTIHPEQVESLVYSRAQLPARLNPLYRKLSGQETILLSFKLFHPAAWIVPNIQSLVPKMADDASTLHAYRLLAGQLALDVHMPGKALSELQASSLCDALSRPGHLKLQTSREHDSFQDWYRGFGPGGKVVTVQEIPYIVSPNAPTASPPSYDELAPSPPSVPPPPLSRKRPRVTSGPSASREKPPLTHQVELEEAAKGVALTDTLCGLILEAEAKEALLRERICAADKRLEQLPDTANNKEDGDENDEDEDEGEEEGIVGRQADREAMKEYIDERLDCLRNELCDFMDERYEELYIDHVLRAEMEEFVDSAIAYAHENLRERLQTGLRVQFVDEQLYLPLSPGKLISVPVRYRTTSYPASYQSETRIKAHHHPLR
ncbi:hypothetical protein VMCG_10935 [Cytospora schulzeri]|uniref:Uncharacterized protein n=1 Tax=Cytospora schulzeri TaxID=448051 RepID=A0A423V7X1_9PEZI|nr:hypothetical protein VMCG_10935 [Valsa malicola]